MGHVPPIHPVSNRCVDREALGSLGCGVSVAVVGAHLRCHRGAAGSPSPRMSRSWRISQTRMERISAMTQIISKMITSVREAMSWWWHISTWQCPDQHICRKLHCKTNKVKEGTMTLITAKPPPKALNTCLLLLSKCYIWLKSSYWSQMFLRDLLLRGN